MPEVSVVLRGKCDAMLDMGRTLNGQSIGYSCPNIADQIVSMPDRSQVRLCADCARAIGKGDWSATSASSIDFNGTRWHRPKMIPLDRIEPLSGVDDPVRMERLYRSMRKWGWSGRALLVVELDRYHGLTGSHRFAAARKAGIPLIPCTVVETQRWRESGLDYQTVRKLPDQKRVAELERVGLWDAAAQIRMEMTENAEDRRREAAGNFEY